MSSSIKKNIIQVTRGDTLIATLDITDAEGNKFIPSEGDIVRFAMKTSTRDNERILVQKIIPNDTLELRLDSNDTDHEPGQYWFDVEVVLNTGDGVPIVDSIITPTKLIITEETGNWRRWT